MVTIDVHVLMVAGGTVGVSCVRLPQFEDVAVVVWAEPDDRGWSWVGTTGPVKP